MSLIRITMKTGTQLPCRRPATIAHLFCDHPPLWRRLLGARAQCASTLLWGTTQPREAFALSGACRPAQLAQAALPSYLDMEAADRRAHPAAHPCKCGDRP